MPIKTFFVFGTRPEAIKMAPLVKTLKQLSDDFDVTICVTGQHREMLDQVLDFFGLVPDHDLKLMMPNQALHDLTANGVSRLQPILEQVAPDLVLVQGDTTTTFIGALCAYYAQVKVGHIEAGLRSGNRYSPFPEEINRRLTDQLTDFHFPPTEKARQFLQDEGITNKVFTVGNTVIDAILLALSLIKGRSETPLFERFSPVDFGKKIVLITGHRRESFGEPFENIAKAIRDSATAFRDIEFVYPVHLNPNVQQPVRRYLSGHDNVHLIEPLDYPDLVWLMEKSHVVLTDSGGIQEEAPSLAKPVLVMRDVTERTEGIEAGTAKLVGTSHQRIVDELQVLLADPAAHSAMAKAVNPYGDGTTSRQVADILRREMG